MNHNRRKNVERMTIPEQMLKITEEMCDKYCKYPDEVHQKYLMDEFENEDDKFEYLMEHYCNDCPLQKLT